MVIELSPDADQNQIRAIRSALAGRFRSARELVVGGRLFITVSGDREDLDVEAIANLPGVVMVTPPDTTAFFTRREFSPDRTSAVGFGPWTIGNGDFIVIAGPCAVESEDDLLATARAVGNAGAHGLRAGAFKPRTSPYNFQGLGLPGLETLRAVGRRTGLPVVSEVLHPDDVESAGEFVDMLQIGTRNMTNQGLLKALGRTQRPVMIKRGFASPLEELIRAAEFAFCEGNQKIVLCERGIQTFERATRFTLDIAAVPALARMTHLPVIVDPSHAAGRRDLVMPLALAAAAAGADGIMVEVHIAPERMIRPGDAAQALRPAEFIALMSRLRTLLGAMGRRLASTPAAVAV